MNSALKFSYKNNFINKTNYLNIVNHISKSKLPNKLSKYFGIKDVKKIVSFMRNDKKNKSNKINLILLKKISKPIINKHFDEKVLINFLNDELID